MTVSRHKGWWKIFSFLLFEMRMINMSQNSPHGRWWGVTKAINGGDMDIIIDKGCGLDVHKETVVACIMGTGIEKEIRTFSTMTGKLIRLKGMVGWEGGAPTLRWKARGHIGSLYLISVSTRSRIAVTGVKGECQWYLSHLLYCKYLLLMKVVCPTA